MARAGPRRDHVAARRLRADAPGHPAAVARYAVSMAKARWWMCDGCRSLNDMPANKCCNKCRAPRPASPTLLDDQYGQVSDKPRVGVSVELSRVAGTGSATIQGDPEERRRLRGVHGAGRPACRERSRRWMVEPSRLVQRLDGNGRQRQPPPIREPVKRGISELGGQDWRIGAPPASESVAPSGRECPAAESIGRECPEPSPPGCDAPAAESTGAHRRQRQQARHMACHPWDRRLESRRCRSAPCRAGRS